MRIVIADDDADSRRLLEDMLGGEGHTVIAAGDGRAALEQIRLKPPDMIISDILMPNLDGFELCRRVKEEPELAAIPFVFYTATYTQPEDERLALALGANRYIVKPAEPGAFLQAIDEVIAANGAGHESTASPDELDNMHRASVARKLDKKQRELQASEQRYRALIEEAPDAMFISDADARYVDVNFAAEKLTGYSRDQLLARRMHDLIDPADLARRPLRIEALLQGEPLRIERALRRHDGTLVPVDVNARRLADGHILTAVRDMSVQKALEARLRQAATVFDVTSEGIMVTDAESRIVAVNNAFSAITGYSEAEAIGRESYILRAGRWRGDVYEKLWQALRREDQWRGEVWDQHKDGHLYPAWTQINVVRDESGRVVNYVVVFADITERKQSQETIDFLVHYDALTGLPNRLLFTSRLEHSLEVARRKHHIVAVLLLDLDRFAHLNDSLGHTVGDELIKQTAERLQGVLRKGDTLARIGGDEFVALIEDFGGAQGAAQVADKLLDIFETPFVLAEREVAMSASLGISVAPEDGTDAETLLKNADSAMFEAKAEGRRSYRFYRRELSVAALDHITLETALRRAIDQHDLELFYQPQVAVPAGNLSGAEALLRWRDPDQGVVSPGKFLPLAEETGLILPIAEWVLREACTQWQQWCNQGIVQGRIAVNISGQQLARGDLVALVDSVLNESNLDPASLELEITEGFFMRRPEETLEVLNGLRRLGVSLAIDDFGTGYSSLAYLKRLPLDLLKIDQTFVRDIPEDANDMAIARAVIALGHSLGLRVIAEGVESSDQAQFLVAEGCDELQGFHFSKPLPAAEFAASVNRLTWKNTC